MCASSPLYIGTNPTNLAAQSRVADGLLDHQTGASLNFQGLKRQRILTRTRRPVHRMQQELGIRRPNRLAILRVAQIAPFCEIASINQDGLWRVRIINLYRGDPLAIW